MASSSKKRTTMAKIARENKLRERRVEKQARKDARKYASANPTPDDEGAADPMMGHDEASAPALGGDGAPEPSPDPVPHERASGAVPGPTEN